MGQRIKWAYLIGKPIGGEPVPADLEYIPLTSPQHLIGRAPTCNTVLEGFTVVSAEHCSICTDFSKVPIRNGTTGMYFLKAKLKDSSMNGTLVNGTLLRKGEIFDLEDGARLEMKGKKVPFYFEFHLEPLSEKEVALLQSSPDGTQTPSRGKPKTTSSPTPVRGITPHETRSDSTSASSEAIILRKRVKELEETVRNLSSEKSIQNSRHTEEVILGLKQKLLEKQEELEIATRKAQDLADQLNDENHTLKTQLLLEREKLKRFEADHLETSGRQVTQEQAYRKELENLQSEFDAEIIRLNQQLKKAKEDYDQLSRTKEEMQEDMELKGLSMASEIQAVKNVVEQLQIDNAKMTKKLAAAEEARDLSEHGFAAFRDAHEKEVATWKQTVQAIEIKLSQKDQSTSSLEAKVKELEDLVHLKDSTLQSKLGALKLLQVRFDELERQAAQEKSDLAESLKLKEVEYSVIAEDFSKRLQMSKKEVTRLATELDETNRALDQVKTHYESQLKTVQHQVDHAKFEADAERAKFKASTARVEDLSRDILTGLKMTVKKLEEIQLVSRDPDYVSPAKRQLRMSQEEQLHQATQMDGCDNDSQRDPDSLPSKVSPHRHGNKRSRTTEDSDIVERSKTEEEKEEDAEGDEEGNHTHGEPVLQVTIVDEEDSRKPASTNSRDRSSQVSASIQPTRQTLGESTSDATLVTQMSTAGNPHQKIPSHNVYDEME